MNSAKSYKIIILGSGIAGLTAAYHLKSNGINDVLILEARDRIGGRLYPFDLSENCGIQLGAQWIHGACQENPLFEFCEKEGLLSAEDSLAFTSGDLDAGRFHKMKVYTSKGKVIADNIVKLASQKYENAMKHVEEQFQHNAQCSREPSGKTNLETYSLADYYDEIIKREICDIIETGEVESEEELLDINNVLSGCKLLYTHYSCEEMHKIGGRLYCAVSDLPGEDVDVPAQKLLAKFKGEIDNSTNEDDNNKILLNHVVQKIDWSLRDDAHIIVECELKHELSKADDVNTRTQFKGEYVICTLPIGVLKKVHHYMFDPPLPGDKIGAIERIGAGVVAKYFVEWNMPWREEDSHTSVMLARSEEELKSKKTFPEDWVKGITQFNPMHQPGHETLMICWIGGECAKVADTVCDEEIAKGIGQILRQFVGNHVTDPHKVIRCCWTKDPFTLGGYSYPTLATKEEDIVNLGRPLPNYEFAQLFFAGEATCPKCWSFLHGAYGSGIAQANKILEQINKTMLP